MATQVLEITLMESAEILGPDSPYDRQRRIFQREVAPVLEASRALAKVDSPETWQRATEFGRLLQVAHGERAAWFKSIKTQIDALKRPVLAAEHEDCDALDAEKRRLGAIITEYTEAERKKAEERDRLAREEAERLAREEALNRAIELEAEGHVEQAEAVLEEEIQPAPVITQSHVAVRPAGQVGKTVYRAELVDPRAFLKAVVDGIIPLSYVEIKQGMLDRRANDDKEGFSLPGCKLKKSTSTHFRG